MIQKDRKVLSGRELVGCRMGARACRCGLHGQMAWHAKFVGRLLWTPFSFAGRKFPNLV